MTYIAAFDFRDATIAEYCQGIALSTAEASDVNLTAAITRFSQRLDDLTNDHFEPESVTLTLSGDDTARLVLPKRCTGVSQVTITDTSAAATTQDSGIYRLRSSLYAAGSKRIGADYADVLELIYGAGGLLGYPNDHWNPYTWPCDANSINVSGSFGWTVTPGDVKRAVALMVWDHFKAQRGDLRRAKAYQTSDLTVEVGQSTPTGIPEVDAIIDDYLYQSHIPLIG